MKTINNYMDKDQGRSISASQVVRVAQWDKVTKELERMRGQKEVLVKCGLVKEAKALQAKINDAEITRRRIEDTANEERKEMARAMLLCFASCDLATIVADMFGEDMHRLTLGHYKKDNDFSKSIREQANSFNKLVQTIDEGEHEPLSMFYADMADEICTKVLPVMQEVIKKWCDTPKGQRYF